MNTKPACPVGMYPMDSDFDTENYDNFKDFKEHAEGASDSLNLPISWFAHDPETEYWEGYEGEVSYFRLIFLMPRKYGKTWSIQLNNYDRAEVMGWLDTWLKGEVNKWYGWNA